MLERTSPDAPALMPSQNRRLGIASEPLVRPPLVRIHLLGSLRATTYLGQNALPRGRKARAVLGYLCLSPGEHVARSRLSALLWDRVPDRQARASFRQALRELSSSFGSLAPELIEATLDTVRLDPELCWVDAVAVRSSGSLPAHSLRGDLAAMCTGELLEDLTGITSAFDQWLLAERTRFSEQLRSLFEGELQQLGTSDTPPERRAALARRVISFDATHEGASRVLMRALSDLGERAQALREYERCRAALRAALDVEPSSETRALYQAMKVFSGQAYLPRTIAPARQVSRTSSPPASPQSSRLRVGVLPLQANSLSGNQRIAILLSQEIAAALARFRWFDVITPMTLAGIPSLDSSQDALQRKHLHYIVDGDISGNEERIQVSIRLLDVTSEARPVWSDRFDLAVDAIDQLSELVISPVVARIDPVILFIESQQKRPKRSGATSLVLQAIPLLYSLEREKYEEAGRLIYNALDSEPENAMVAAWAAHWQLFHVGQGWSTDPQGAFETAQDLCIRAIRNDPENAEALGIYGHICAFLDKDFDAALYYFDRALRLNPNLAFVWALSAATYCYIGEPDQALGRLNRCRDLAPFDPYLCLWENVYTIAYTFKGDYEKAVGMGKRIVKANPQFSNGYKPLIVALGHLGRSGEAKPYIDKLLSIDPSFTVVKYGKVYPFRRAEDRERFMRGLILAGVPES